MPRECALQMAPHKHSKCCANRSTGVREREREGERGCKVLSNLIYVPTTTIKVHAERDTLQSHAQSASPSPSQQQRSRAAETRQTRFNDFCCQAATPRSKPKSKNNKNKSAIKIIIIHDNNNYSKKKQKQKEKEKEAKLLLLSLLPCTVNYNCK